MQKNKEIPSDVSSPKFRSKSVQSGIKLSIATKHFLSFFAEVDRYIEHLSATPAINNAIRRYETIWLPLAAAYGLLGPPIDVHWIWCVHMLSPINYKQDCIAFTNKLIDHRCLPLKELQKAREASRKIWVSKYPDEPFEFDPNSSANLDYISCNSKLSQNLRESVSKHFAFHYQVSLPHYQDIKFLEESVVRYKKFVFLQLQYPEQVMLPLIDIALIWHCHKVHPSVYSKDTKSSIDKIILKNHAIPDLLWIQTSMAMESTADLWAIVFKDKYMKPGCQYRGRSVKGKLIGLSLADSYFISTKSAQLQIKCVSIEPHQKLDKYSIQFSNPLVALQPFSNYLVKLKSPEKYWPHKPGQKFVTNTSLITGTVESFTMEVVDRRGLFCANNSILTSKKICLLDFIENFLGTESQTLEMTFDIGKEKDISLGEIRLTLILHPPERHATRLKMVLGENALLRVPLYQNSFWGAISIFNDMTTSISSDNIVECYLLSHSIINHIKKEVLIVKIIHSVSMDKSIVQVLYQNEVVAISETIGLDQLPTPNTTHNSEMLVLEPNRSERAFIIKDNSGDWGFIIGRWDRNITGSRGSRSNDISNVLPYGNEDQFSRFSIRSYWLRGEKKIQYAHIPDSMNSWSVVLNDVSFDLSTGEIHISRQCTDIAQSVCLAFSCAALLALCKSSHPEHTSIISHSPEIKPPSESFTGSLYLPPNSEIISIPPIHDFLIRKKDSNNFSSTFQDPSKLLMCIGVGINFNEYLPTFKSSHKPIRIKVTELDSINCPETSEE